jgi:hypothetical protein
MKEFLVSYKKQKEEEFSDPKSVIAQNHEEACDIFVVNKVFDQEIRCHNTVLVKVALGDDVRNFSSTTFAVADSYLIN